MTRDEALSLYRSDPRGFNLNFYAWSHLLRVSDRETQRKIPFLERPAQRRLNDAVDAAEREGRPTRTIVLKSRRVGISTGTVARFTHRTATRIGTKSLIVAHLDTTATELHNIGKAFYDSIPDRIKLAQTNVDADKIYRLAGGGWARNATARTFGSGRGMEATNILLTEFASYPAPEQIMTSLNSTVPDTPGTWIGIESTADGMGNSFHRRWLEAEAGRGSYAPLFISWLDDPVNTIRTDLDYVEPIDEVESVLITALDATPGQILWRRQKLQDYDDLSLFQQEFPHTPEVAFRTSGLNYFGIINIDRFRPVDPIGRFRIVGSYAFKGAPVKLERDPTGACWVYEGRQPHTRYVLAVDAMGDISELDLRNFGGNADDARDYAAICIVNCRTMEPVCFWHGRANSDKLAEITCILSTIFNRAVVAPENSGGYGAALIAEIQALGRGAHASVPMHYERRRAHKTDDELTFTGFRTDPTTRPIMLDNLRQVLRNSPEKLKHAPLKAEMVSFVEGAGRKPAAMKGTHDDIVMSTAIAMLIAQQYAQAPLRIDKPVRRQPVPEGAILALAPTRGV